MIRKLLLFIWRLLFLLLGTSEETAVVRGRVADCLGLDQASSHGVAHEACRFMDIQFLHEPARWDSAVFTLMPSKEATSLVDFPSAISWST